MCGLHSSTNINLRKTDDVEIHSGGRCGSSSADVIQSVGSGGTVLSLEKFEGQAFGGTEKDVKEYLCDSRSQHSHYVAESKGAVA